ncbi:MAG: phosphoglucomutase/phosphomannomutase family protein [Symbiobacteriaceae bacterium]|jgi:phosphoglucomutase|nr:phosphoglucomutase/phosphomannomutase family protein [Symbiobacteriaceae bacterium]
MSTTADYVRLWTGPYFDEATRRELGDLAGNQAELDDRFYQLLDFGTAGMRGKLGAGTNRMNRYVVRHATQGLANYINATVSGPKRVVIAHDCRHFSKEFALEAALTLNASGIYALVWDDLRPTPMLSFAVRYFSATAGIVITASHNPKEYNGYKVYWSDGGQVPPERADAIGQRIRAITDITTIHPMDEAEARTKNLLKTVAPWVDRTYYDKIGELLTTDRAAREVCRILFTPLHGTGSIPVQTVLAEAGFQVSVVKAQELPDADFSTVRSPNPEEPAVFALALDQAAAEQPDIIMATDPDADRLGAMLRDQSGKYRLLTGNQIGAILVDYILASRKANGTLPANGAVIKSTATSNMLAPLCRAHGVALIDVHTGFKFIGDKIREFEETGSHTFLFGFEESYGYLGATFVRDKDAVMAAAMLADAVAYHKAHGRTLFDALEALWERYGYFAEGLHNVTLPGREGQAQIAGIMAALRKKPPISLGSTIVEFVDDYATGFGLDMSDESQYPLPLDRANVLHYRFDDGGFVMVRPSGTEPKLKVYFSVVGGDRAEAEARLAAVRRETLTMMGLA